MVPGGCTNYDVWLDSDGASFNLRSSTLIVGFAFHLSSPLQNTCSRLFFLFYTSTVNLYSTASVVESTEEMNA